MHQSIGQRRHRLCRCRVRNRVRSGDKIVLDKAHSLWDVTFPAPDACSVDTRPLPPPPKDALPQSQLQEENAHYDTYHVSGVSSIAVASVHSALQQKHALRAASARSQAADARADAKASLAEARELKRKATDRDFSHREAQEAASEANRRIKERRGSTAGINTNSSSKQQSASLEVPEWAERFLSPTDFEAPNTLIGSSIALHIRRKESNKPTWHEASVSTSAATAAADLPEQQGKHEDGQKTQEQHNCENDHAHEDGRVSMGVLLLTYTKERADEITPVSRLVHMARDGCVALVKSA